MGKNNIDIKNINGDVIGAGTNGIGNIIGKEIQYTVKGNVININNPSNESLEELKKILVLTSESPADKSSITKGIKTPHELDTIDKRIDEMLNLLKTVEDKMGTHNTKIQAGQLNISRVDLLLKRAVVLTESTNRFWNVSSKGSDINGYVRKNKEAYLLLKEASRLEPYNTQVLLLMAKVQAKLTPNNLIKMQKILHHLKNILDMPANEAEKFQLAQATFLLAIFNESIDDQLLQDARLMFENIGRTDWVRQCDSLLQPKNEKSSRAWTDRGWTLGLLQMYDQAIECFDKALEIEPINLKALRGKGSVLGRLRRYKQAIECYDRALEIEPNNYSLYRGKGTAYYYLEKYDEAIECFDKALEIDPTDENTWNSKGLCLYRIEKYDEAIECYDRALEIKADDEDAWNSKGECLYKLQKNHEAIICYDKSISIDPNNALVWHNKGLCLDSIYQHKNAEDCFNKANELDRV